MKRLVFVLIIALLILSSAPLQYVAFADSPGSSVAVTSSVPQLNSITADSVMLLDANTGDILWQKNPDDKHPIASTTKIMTALVAIKYGNLDDDVVVNADALAPGREGGIGLAAGEHLKLRDLLYALMLPSANDAAVAIADHVGGTTANFVETMNTEAALIGAGDTHFTNPHGLDGMAHYSTAHDLAIITRYALQDQVFSQIVSTNTMFLGRANPGLSAILKNHNALLTSYPGATGVKTGYTRGAGNCLVSSATRDGVSLIAVELGVKQRKDMFNESAVLLDYGFSLYEREQLISKGHAYKVTVPGSGQEVGLVATEDVIAVVRKSVPVNITSSTTNVDVPAKKGTVFGRVTVKQAGRVIAISNLVAKEDTKQPILEQLTSPYLIQLKGKLI